MPKFRVSGRGKETNRKRSKIYYARSEKEVRKNAISDNMVVETVERLPDDPPPPPTESQLDFAKHLKLTIPEDANKWDVSELIENKVTKLRQDGEDFNSGDVETRYIDVGGLSSGCIRTVIWIIFILSVLAFSFFS